MSTTTCPNCGKPLRPGSKFCGNCGNTISVAAPSKAAAPTPQPGGAACPHCGKPVRVGARFCNSCGKPIPEGAQPTAVAPQVPRPVVPPPGAQVPPPPQAAAPRPVPPAPERKPTRKNVWIGALVGILAIVCALAAVGTFVYIRVLDDPWKLLGEKTATPIESATRTILVTEKVTGTETIPPSTPYPAATELPPVETLPGILPPTAVVTTPVGVISTTEVITPPLTPVATSQGVVIFEDNFDGGINLYWIPWGKPWPSIKNGPSDNWLELTASQNPGSSGITSKMEVPSITGVEIEFIAQLIKSYSRFELVFDWDPLNVVRDANYPSPGVVHLEIMNDSILLKAPFGQSICQRNIDGVERHKYRIRFVENQAVLFFIDDQSEATCEIPNTGRESMGGHISFTGMGWVIQVKVTRP